MNGQTVKAQQTATKQSAITEDQQLHWHAAIDSLFAELESKSLPS